MPGNSRPTDPTTLSPDEWSSEPEQRYARHQSRFAEQSGLDIESRVFDSDAAGRIHYLTAGPSDGEPVVLLHGITEPAATWLPMMPALGDRYRLYAPDLPGEGLSAKPSYRGRDLRSFLTAYLLELFDALGEDRLHVVAHSLGGWQAFLLALDHECVERLCFVGAPVGVSRAFPVLVRLFTLRGINRLLFWMMSRGDGIENARAWVNRFGVVDDSGVPEMFYELYAVRHALPGLQRSLRSLMIKAGSFGRMISLTDLSDEVGAIESPTAFVWGTEDYYWEPAVGRRVADTMPDAVFQELPNHGHTPWLEPGGEAGERVRAFLDGSDAESAAE